MKTLTTSLVLVAASLCCYGQEESAGASHHKTLFSELKANYGIVDLSYTHFSVAGTEFGGFGMTLGGVLNDFWYTGLHFDIGATSRITLGEPPVDVVNPRFVYYFVGLHNEFMLFPSSPVHISFPLRFGLGGVSFNDSYYQGFNQNARIDQDNFMVIEPGLKLNINLWKHVGITGGAAYRFVGGASRGFSNDAYSAPVFHAGIRLKIWE